MAVKMRTSGALYDTVTSRLLQEHVIREGKPMSQTIGFERLYKTTDGGYWIHERFYRNAGGDQDTAVPLTENEARGWLKDRFGGWNKFARLESRVFGG
jgi:hypothetical protein